MEEGILKGLGVTLKRYWNTYWDDIVWLFQGKKRYNSPEGIAHRSSKDARGIFTVQFPEERLLLSERDTLTSPSLFTMKSLMARRRSFALHVASAQRFVRRNASGSCAQTTRRRVAQSPSRPSSSSMRTSA